MIQEGLNSELLLWIFLLYFIINLNFECYVALSIGVYLMGNLFKMSQRNDSCPEQFSPAICYEVCRVAAMLNLQLHFI